jgi:hypothetical protein
MIILGVHRFSDMQTASTETSPVAMPNVSNFATLLYGKLKSTAFRLSWLDTCASRPNRIGRIGEALALAKRSNPR